MPKWRRDGRAILFIGYSLQYVNTRYLLFRLQELWKTAGYFQQRPKSFIFMVDENPAQAAVLKSRGIEPILAPQADPKESAKTFLGELVRQVKGSRSVKLSSTKSKKEL